MGPTSIWLVSLKKRRLDMNRYKEDNMKTKKTTIEKPREAREVTNLADTFILNF